MKLEWSAPALADLKRFALFLDQHYPSLAEIVADEIVEKAQILLDHPQLGRPIAGPRDYRQLLLSVLNATYIFQYRLDGERIVMLRVFHSRENRE